MIAHLIQLLTAAVAAVIKWGIRGMLHWRPSDFSLVFFFWSHAVGRLLVCRRDDTYAHALHSESNGATVVLLAPLAYLMVCPLSLFVSLRLMLLFILLLSLICNRWFS
jgi:hypothetical protein